MARAGGPSTTLHAGINEDADGPTNPGMTEFNPAHRAFGQ